jgi:hypothetical protein
MSTATTPQYKELAQRTRGGVEVTLYWATADDRLLVVVDDERTGDLFEFEIDASHALDAVEHPYAYAAQRGIEYVAGRSSPVYTLD